LCSCHEFILPSRRSVWTRYEQNLVAATSTSGRLEDFYLPQCDAVECGRLLLMFWMVCFKVYCGGPGSSPGQVMWDLWWTKWHWDRFSSNTLVSSTKSNSINMLHIHHHLSSGAVTTGQTVAAVPSGLKSHPMKSVSEEHAASIFRAA
jgi:hypothetical protein